MNAPPLREPTELRGEEEAASGELLARAFDDDPIFVWIEPADAARREFLVPLFTALTRRSRRLAVALAARTADAELAGVSLWKTPELTTLSAEQLAMTGLDRLGDFLSPAASRRFDAVFHAVDAALAEDVREPVWYLGVLGVEPSLRGRGLGSALMRPLLERADREGLATTLETAKARNLALYARHGFEVLRELPPPAPGGPVVWTMRRPPRPSVGA